MKRTRPLIWICIIVLAFSTTAAQDDDTSGWPVEQRCVGEPTAPPEGWTFEGTIFVQRDDGVHAIRSDVSTPYFVAFNGRDLTSAGTISPDGKWYAVPSGYSEYVSMLDDGIIVEEIRVYSTNPAHEIFRVPWRVSYRGMRDYGLYFVSPIRWLDNEQLIYESGSWLLEQYEASVINPFTGEISLWEGELQNLHTNLYISPDWTRAVGYHGGESGVFDTMSGNLLTDLSELYSLPRAFWSPDSSQFASPFPGQTDNAISNLALFDRDGSFLETIFSVAANSVYFLDFKWSPDRHEFAFTVRREEEFRLYIGDINDRIIIDTCLALSNAAWSPTGKELAFEFYTGSGNVIGVYDLEAETSLVLAYYPGSVIAWREGW